MTTASMFLANPISDPFRVWAHAHHRSSENVLLFRPQAENTRNDLLHWWNNSRLSEMAVHRSRRRDFWLSKSIRVRYHQLTLWCTRS